MAPPVEEAPTKVVKVATTVVRRQSTKAEEMKSTTPPAMDDDLHLTVLEESFRNAQSGYEGRSAVISKRCVFLLCTSHYYKLASLLLYSPQVGPYSWKRRRGYFPFQPEVPVAWIHSYARCGKVGDKSFPRLRHCGQLD